VMFTQLLYMIAPAVMGAIFPGLARAYTNSPTRFAYLVSWLFKFLLILTFPIMLFVVAFADKMILLVFGDAYTPSIIVLQITALGVMPSFLSRLLFRAILASDNERLAVRATLIANLANLLLNIILIPRYGVLGASISAVGTIFVNTIQNLWYVTRFTKFDFLHALIVPGLCTAVSGFLFVLLMQYSLPLAFIVSIITFAIALIASKTVSPEDFTNLSLVKSP
ncbi:MAG: polysaccharide biosynthesis C-terminal domain-containing protein, partial [Anaerolineales bacterium]|nr:polysaccharide biosynthesis C-terminal domain-containing protein [Anaerolineales bacterium]